MRDESLEDFNRILGEVATSLFATVQEEVNQATWRSAYVDVRSPAGGGARIDKLRITMQDGTIIKSLHVTMDLTMCCCKIWAIKDKVFPEKWFGIKVTVTSDGQCETEFNYDEECINDPAFYDVDE